MATDRPTTGLENAVRIILGLNTEIADRRMVVSSEREAPSWDPDKSDDVIKRGRREILRLETIRKELEEIFFGDIGDQP